MEISSNPMDLSQYGNLPRHVQQRLATEKTQPSDAPATPAPNLSETPAEITPNTADAAAEWETATPTATEDAHASGNAPAQNGEHPAQNEAERTPDTEANAWKGRLTKEQEAHKATNARLLAEAEARQKAEAEAKAMQAKLAELESRLNPNPNPTSVPPPSAQSDSPPLDANAVEKPFGEGFSEEDWTDLAFNLGDSPLAKKLVAQIRSQGIARPSAPAIDVAKVVEEKFSQVQAQQAEQAEIAAFGAALASQVPQLQGLMQDPAFVQFTQEKVIDFAGNTASAFINYVGQTRNTALLPKLQALVNEFEQLRNPPPVAVTAPPSNPSVAVATKSGKKPKPTPEIVAQMNRLMRQGDVVQLRALQEKYDY